jgi:hypothetical protein
MPACAQIDTTAAEACEALIKAGEKSYIVLRIRPTGGYLRMVYSEIRIRARYRQ